jgi:hypothetical protein
MGETLMGGTKSGTPLETRQGSSDFAAMLQNMMRGGPGGLSDAFGRMTSEAWTNMLGFNPADVGLDEAAMAALRDPAERVRGLFASMEPFEERETQRQVAGQREMFGTMGGRFGRNLAGAEGELRGELSSQFGRNRQQALLQAGAMRNQALQSIMQGSTAARSVANQETMLPFQLMSQFFQPGAPIMTEGLLPGLIGAGANLGGMFLMNKFMKDPSQPTGDFGNFGGQQMPRFDPRWNPQWQPTF